MASEVGICNAALQKLGASRITTLTDGTNNATECNAAYARLRDKLLRSFRWNFAKKLVQVAAEATGPVFGKANKFQLPSDCLRPLPPDRYTCDWQIKGRFIHTDEGAPLNLEYIYRVTDVNEMDDSFRDALSSLIAWELCEKINQSNTKKRDAKDMFKDSVAEARKLGSFEELPEEGPDDSWITSRY